MIKNVKNVKNVKNRLPNSIEINNSISTDNTVLDNGFNNYFVILYSDNQ